MANIEIYELSPAGAELFLDSESYMEEISELELNSLGISGKGSPLIATIVSVSLALVPGNTLITF